MGWVVFHVPNEGRRGQREAERLQREGVVAGAPDLVCVRGGRVVFLEMKKPGGRVSAAQKQFHAALRRAGAEVHVCEGWEAATCILDNGKPNASSG